MANKIWKYNHKTIVHFGAGALDLLPGVANPLAGDRKIMLVTDSSGIMEKNGVVAKITEMLGAERTVLFNRVPPNPDAAIVAEGLALHRAEGCGLLVGLGGGSPIDAAKAIAVMSTHDGDIVDYFTKKLAWGTKAEPVVAIPTTAGTGTEVNGNFVVTLPHDNLKCGTAAPCAWPAAALLDPTLTLSLPPYQTSSTGLDALSHALEALWAVNGQPLSDMNAFESIPIILKWLPEAVSDGSNLEARSNMLYASMTASLAFGSTGTCASRALLRAHLPLERASRIRLRVHPARSSRIQPADIHRRTPRSASRRARRGRRRRSGEYRARLLSLARHTREARRRRSLGVGHPDDDRSRKPGQHREQRPPARRRRHRSHLEKETIKKYSGFSIQ